MQAAASPKLDPRTRLLLEGPIAPTLLKLAAPNMLMMLVQAAVGLIETFFVGKLGTDALAGMSLVFPLFMLMTMMSAGAMGGGIASSIARALGSGRRADANALVLHASAIAVGFGLAFTTALIFGGRWVYAAMGGTGASLEAALAYSNWIFAGAVLVWLFNSLAAVIRGAGNMTFPALVSTAGAAVLIPVSPVLIFGWGPVPALGIAGGAVAALCYYLIGTLCLAAYLLSGRSVVRPGLRGFRFRKPLFWDILRVGLVAALTAATTNLTIAVCTGLVGTLGPAAIAGYGTASRLEYVLVPIVFGLGAPLVTMVGTNIGAGRRERALRTAWIGGGIAFVLTESIGLAAALFPYAWLTLFDSDPAMLDAGARYLSSVGPIYGFFGLGLSLYFASQGAGRLLLPLAANLLRFAVAALGGWLVLRATGNLTYVFLTQAAALVVYGVGNAAVVAGGAWFGPIRWPRAPRIALSKG